MEARRKQQEEAKKKKDSTAKNAEEAKAEWEVLYFYKPELEGECRVSQEGKGERQKESTGYPASIQLWASFV